MHFIREGTGDGRLDRGDRAGSRVQRADLAPTHHFTVDVEEYFQVSAFERRISRAEWDRFESRVAPTVCRILDLLGRHDARGTFFVLGWVAERHPGLVRTIAQAGHEVASHGWDHRKVTDQTPEEFYESVRRAREVLEATAGSPVSGFRAPSFSIVPGREWAIDALIETGHRYDSSLFPVRRSRYGYPDGLRRPYRIGRPAGTLIEVPPATLRWGPWNLPAAGGAYFRLFPYGLVRAALLDSERKGIPATFYIHPWEIDPDQPRLDVAWTTRIRHYGGIERTLGRLRRLLEEFRFQTISETAAALERADGRTPHDAAQPPLRPAV